MIHAQTSLSSALDQAIAAVDIEKAAGEYREQGEFLFIPRFLSADAVALLMEDVERLTPSVNRNYIPGHKKGGSVSYFSIAGQGPRLKELYDSARLKEFFARVVSANLHLCPEDDPHRCALYFYTEAGDHIGFHYDTSYYQGARYTVLLGLVQQSSSRLLCRLHTREKNHRPKDLEVSTEPGSLVLFNGDTVYHAVSPSKKGERRVVLTMEYVTNRKMGGAKKVFSRLKDAFAYFGLDTLFSFLL